MFDILGSNFVRDNTTNQEEEGRRRQKIFIIK
jgi:hypothetical protein